MMTTTEAEARITWDDIRRMRDEVEVQIHLAGMDMKDRWKALAPRLHAVEKAVASTAISIADDVKEELHSLRTIMQEMRDDVAEKSSRRLAL
jgi:uncharacterized protein with HEPN domain